MSKSMLTGLLLTVALVTIAQAQENVDLGVVKGKVVNGTDSSIKFAGREVRLLMFSKGGSMQQKKMNTDDNSSFRFTGLPVGPDHIYMVSANYRNVLYHTGRISFKDSKEAEVVLAVYETTTTDEDVYIESEHLIIKQEPEGYTVTGIIAVNNRGSRTYVGPVTDENKEAETLFFTMPEGYRELKLVQLIPPQFIRQKPDGFALVEPVPPGPVQFNFSYRLPASPMPTKLGKEVKYPTGNINILYGDPAADITSDRLTNMGVMDFGGSKYQVLAGRDFPGGSFFSITIGGGRAAANWVRNNQRLLIAVFLIGLGAVLGVFIALGTRRRGPAERESFSAMEMEEQKEELIEYIASLDDRFQAGELSGREYDRDRNEKKAQLVEIVRMIQQKRGQGID